MRAPSRSAGVTYVLLMLVAMVLVLTACTGEATSNDTTAPSDGSAAVTESTLVDGTASDADALGEEVESMLQDLTDKDAAADSLDDVPELDE